MVGNVLFGVHAGQDDHFGEFVSLTVLAVNGLMHLGFNQFRPQVGKEQMQD